tara:strand:- start:1872 stop:2060 length:189 start_codon:yes stop_codon:yes gene_type:complete
MSNTRKMNELEELGRVDAEHAFTKKGKYNLDEEKKRVVREVESGTNSYASHNKKTISALKKG